MQCFVIIICWTIVYESHDNFTCSDKLVWPVLLTQVLPCPQLIFPSKTWFLEFIWIFSCRNHLKINISHILNLNLAKWFILNPPHQDLSNNTKGTLQFLRNFQLQFNLIFSEEIIQCSRTSTPQVQTPWKPSWCTRPPQELSKETKNAIWSIPVRWMS